MRNTARGRITTRLALALVAALALSSVAGALAGTRPTLEAQLDGVVAAGSPGAILYARDGGRVVSLARGVADSTRKIPLRADYTQDISKMIEAANQHASEVGFFYLCNPNNPTGLAVPKQEVKSVVDGIPKDMPILIDEAYHHFVSDPNYEESVGYVKEGKPVIIARTFSKIAALAAMRLGYAVARPDIIQKMRPFSMGSINVLVKHGGVAALTEAGLKADVVQVPSSEKVGTIVAQNPVAGTSVDPGSTVRLNVSKGRTETTTVTTTTQTTATARAAAAATCQLRGIHTRGAL